jgi:hypothetical protein
MNPLCSPLLTDLYELTMLQAYFERGMTDTAVFELFVRKLPPKRDFLVAAGLEQALDFIEDLRFGDEELDWIRGCGHFKPAFADQLAKLRFTGDVHALPEGTIFFPNEPLLRVTAPRRGCSPRGRAISPCSTDLDRARQRALRHPGVRHHGTFVCAGARERGRSLRPFRRSVPRACRNRASKSRESTACGNSPACRRPSPTRSRYRRRCARLPMTSIAAS